MGFHRHILECSKNQQDIPGCPQPNIGDDNEGQTRPAIHQPDHGLKSQCPNDNIGNSKLIIKDPGNHGRGHHGRHHHRKDDYGANDVLPPEFAIQENSQAQARHHSPCYGGKHEEECVEHNHTMKLGVRNDLHVVLESNEGVFEIGEEELAQAGVDTPEYRENLKDKQSQYGRGDQNKHKPPSLVEVWGCTSWNDGLTHEPHPSGNGSQSSGWRA